jgi:excisionase family DNA binding protein
MHRSEINTAPARESIPAREAYPVPEVAVLMGGVTPRFVWTLISTGELPSIKIGNRRLVAHDDIKAYIRALREDGMRARTEALR